MYSAFKEFYNLLSQVKHAASFLTAATGFKISY